MESTGRNLLEKPTYEEERERVSSWIQVQAGLVFKLYGGLLRVPVTIAKQTLKAGD
jgi:hypothetical protein